MTDELKPCPFCYSEVEIKGSDDTEYWIECLSCETAGTGMINSKEEAIEIWNNRPIEDELNQRIAELEEQLKIYKNKEFRNKIKKENKK